MKKEDLRVDVSTPEKHAEVIKLLQELGEPIYYGSLGCNGFRTICWDGKKWICYTYRRCEHTLSDLKAFFGTENTPKVGKKEFSYMILVSSLITDILVCVRDVEKII